MRYIASILFLFFMSFTACAEELVFITGMRVEPSQTKTSIIFNLTATTSGSVKFYPKDNSLVLIFTNTRLRFAVSNAKLEGSNIIDLSAAETADNKVIWTMHTRGQVGWKTQLQINNSTKQIEMQLDVISVQVKPKAELVRPAAFQQARMEAPAPVKEKNKSRVFTVVIDAGHGGKDTGAVSKNGVREKDVVLSIAKKMATKLEKIPGVRVLMTRKGDYYVPLRARLNIARKDPADLFIAVHADAYFTNNAIGASVYALSEHGATNEASRWLARQEHYSELDGIDFDRLPDRSRMVRSVLIDLSQTATIRDSMRLGNKVLGAMERVTPLHYRQVEQAPFMVLKSPDIPSILVETGFISNAHEAQKLADPAYQDQLAEAVCRGVRSYMKKYASQ